MTSSSSPRILLIGATGYIGGTILDQLTRSSSPTLRSATITCLVRREEHAARLSTLYPSSHIQPALFKGLDDTDVITAAAAQHDLVINSALSYHAAAAQALLQGLARRKAETGRDVWLVHTSGTSNLGDRPVSGAWVHSPPDREFDDAADNVYAFEQERNAHEEYHQRTTDLGIIDASLQLGVRALVIMSPTIYGKGTGPFNTISIQVPAYIRAALKHGRAVVLGDGKGEWDNVHILDLAQLYEMVVLEILERNGAALPEGEKAIIFSASGRHSWMDIAQAVANTCHAEGKLQDKSVENVGLAEGIKIFSYLGDVTESIMEVGLSSNARTVASVARGLGWKPTRGDEAWDQGIRDDVKAVAAEN